MSKVEQADVKQIIVQHKDGSTWTAQIEIDGSLTLLKQLTNPDLPPAEVAVEQEMTPVTPEKPAETKEAPKAPEAPEAPEVPVTEKGYSDADLEKLIKKLSNREMREYNNGKDQEQAEAKPLPKKVEDQLKDNAFKARLASVMLDNKYDRRVKGRTRGKLDMTRLFKVPTGSRSVFMKKESRKGKQYNVVLLVDESGSMNGRPAQLAAESATFLTKQMTDIGINVGIIGFNSNVHVHKDLLEKPNYGKIYREVADSGGGNCDYDAMRRAFAMLDRAPDGKNIFIMLSDGNPTGYKAANTFDSRGKKESILKPMPPKIDYDKKEHFHHLVKSHKNVSSIGIGIQQGGWQVPDHTVIHDVGDLKKTIIATLRKHISRG